MTSKERKLSLLQDECLACLGYFAYSTGRTTRAKLVKAFAASTRQDEESKGSREGWWRAKFDNIHYAFKSYEGQSIHGREIPRTTKRGLISTKGVQDAIRDGALHLFLRKFEKCLEHAVGALDKSLPANDYEAVFGGVSEDGRAVYGRDNLTQGQADSLQGRAAEGERKLRQHWYLERDSSLPRQAKEAFEARHGELFCEICGLLPVPTYGHPILDAHHKLPLSKYAESGKLQTGPEDFAILCPSCHRAVHKHKDCDMGEVARRITLGKIRFRTGK